MNAVPLHRRTESVESKHLAIYKYKYICIYIYTFRYIKSRRSPLARENFSPTKLNQTWTRGRIDSVSGSAIRPKTVKHPGKEKNERKKEERTKGRTFWKASNAAEKRFGDTRRGWQASVSSFPFFFFAVCLVPPQNAQAASAQRWMMTGGGGEKKENVTHPSVSFRSINRSIRTAFQRSLKWTIYLYFFFSEEISLLSLLLSVGSEKKIAVTIIIIIIIMSGVHSDVSTQDGSSNGCARCEPSRYAWRPHHALSSSLPIILVYNRHEPRKTYTDVQHST